MILNSRRKKDESDQAKFRKECVVLCMHFAGQDMPVHRNQ